MSVSTTPEHELGNIEKCLEAGCRHVALVSPHRRKLTRIQEAVAASLAPEQTQLVGFYTPAEFILKLNDWALEEPADGKSGRGKPRKRKIALSVPTLSEEERSRREVEMLRQLAEAMKKTGANRLTNRFPV